MEVHAKGEARHDRRDRLARDTISAPAALPGLDFSDHLNYWAHDWNAVMITDTAFYRNHAYHSLDDISSRLDYSRMSDVVVAVYGRNQRLAVTSRRLKRYPDPQRRKPRQSQTTGPKDAF